MKKSSFKVLLLTAITASSPLMAVSSHFYKPGFYAGLAAGHSYMRSDVKESVFIPALINTNGSGTAKKHGVVGEILGGYRYFFANGLRGLNLVWQWIATERKRIYNWMFCAVVQH